MPAPSFLKGLPKPVLFGLYGAVGGLLGALVFGEPLWRLLEPPKSPPPEPQVAVAASKSVELFVGQKNTFTVQVDRAGFEGPVAVRFENVPAGLAIEPLTIDKGKAEAEVTVQSTPAGKAATARVRVVAEGDAAGKRPTATTDISVAVSDPARPQADVFFVIDVTQSMDWAINGLANGIGEFASHMRAQKIDFRVGVLAFRDLWINQPSQLLTFHAGGGGADVFTSDDREFSSEVSRLRATGGGDAPESTLDAILEATGQPFRKGATKVLLVITDNPPKNIFKQGAKTDRDQTASAAEIRQTAGTVKAAGIDLVHLVIDPNDLGVYRPIQDAGSGKGRFFELAVAAKGREGFKSLVTDFSRDVVEVARAKSPEGKVKVAEQAERPSVKGVQSSVGYQAGTEKDLLLAIAVWTGAIAALVCLALLAGQHHYLRGSLPAAGGMVAGVLGGLVVGLAGGAAGQGLFMLAPDSAILAGVFRVLGWALLGGLAGVGLSLFIPNLRWVHGLAGGAIGGAAGAAGFLVVSVAGGDLIGRLVGGLILGLCIGLMVAIVEAAFRRAWLEVRFGPRETITVNLGPEPVKVGGDGRNCTVWARGAPDLALRYFIRNGQVICEDAPTRTEATVGNGDVREVGNVTVTVRTGSSVAPSAPTRTTAATPQRPVPPQAAVPKKPELLDLGPMDDDPLPVVAAAKPPAPPQAAKPAPPVPTAPAAKPPAPSTAKPPIPPLAAVPKPAPPAPAPKPAAGPRDPDACPGCGRKNPGRPGARYCMVCDNTY